MWTLIILAVVGQLSGWPSEQGKLNPGNGAAFTQVQFDTSEECSAARLDVEKLLPGSAHYIRAVCLYTADVRQ